MKYPAHFADLAIVESAHLTVTQEDWSRVRSWSRARRRRACGFRQNIASITVPDPLGYIQGNRVFMHPATAAKFKASLSA